MGLGFWRYVEIGPATWLLSGSYNATDAASRQTTSAVAKREGGKDSVDAALCCLPVADGSRNVRHVCYDYPRLKAPYVAPPRLSGLWHSSDIVYNRKKLLCSVPVLSCEVEYSGSTHGGVRMSWRLAFRWSALAVVV